VIDGTGGAPIEHGRIVIQGDRIVQVGTTVPLPPDAEIVDLSGRTIVPGLIDLHFHIENDPKLALRQLSHGEMKCLARSFSLTRPERRGYNPRIREVPAC